MKPAAALALLALAYLLRRPLFRLYLAARDRVTKPPSPLTRPEAWLYRRIEEAGQ